MRVIFLDQDLRCSFFLFDKQEKTQNSSFLLHIHVIKKSQNQTVEG